MEFIWREEEFSTVRLFFVEPHKINEFSKDNNSPPIARSILPIARIERANFFIFKMQKCVQSFEKWLSCVEKTPLKSSFSMFF